MPTDLLLLETKDLLFINKPKGMLVHGVDSLEEALRGPLLASREVSLSFSPGPLHRLDRNTSGIVTFPRTVKGAQVFSEKLRQGRLAKLYLALLSGRMAGEEYWVDAVLRDTENRISRIEGGGISSSSAKAARTRVLPLIVEQNFTLAAIAIETGRTHQIRVQAASHGHPLLGDNKYGGAGPLAGYILHAWQLRFLDHLFPDLPSCVSAALPYEAETALARLFGPVSSSMLLGKIPDEWGRPQQKRRLDAEIDTNYQGGFNG